MLDEKCDNKETLLSIINDLYTQFILSGKKTHVVLEGDQVTYERLHSIRAEYGSESKWLVLFPGDCHFLKNYQEVLIKIYFDVGLSDLAKASGYLHRSVGTNFKRTHRFLLESWEKQNNHCGPGCKCTGCTNLPVEALSLAQEEASDAESEASNSSGEDLEHEVNELMCDIFGDSEIEEVHSIGMTEDSFNHKHQLSYSFSFIYTTYDSLIYVHWAAHWAALKFSLKTT